MAYTGNELALLEQRTWSMFIEARSNNCRTQWIIFSPARDDLLELKGVWHQQQRMIKRSLPDKSRWTTVQRETASELRATFQLELQQYEAMGWKIQTPVIATLDADDYQRVWTDPKNVKTPYKALRHLEKETLKYGYRITTE